MTTDTAVARAYARMASAKTTVAAGRTTMRTAVLGADRDRGNYQEESREGQKATHEAIISPFGWVNVAEIQTILKSGLFLLLALALLGRGFLGCPLGWLCARL